MKSVGPHDVLVEVRKTGELATHRLFCPVPLLPGVGICGSDVSDWTTAAVGSCIAN